MNKDIGYRIRKIRESKDYSQGNMAAELNITPGAYAKIERGETDPSATRLISIAEILEVDVMSFFKEMQPAASEQTIKMTEASSKAELETLFYHINLLNSEIEKLKSEMTELKKEVHQKKSK